MDRTISFLITKRLPQLGQRDNKDTYSISFVLFQSFAQDKHFMTDRSVLIVGNIFIIHFCIIFYKMNFN